MMRFTPFVLVVPVALACAVTALRPSAGDAPATRLKSEQFDRDPAWEGHNNRTAAAEQRSVQQDFGYSASTHVNAQPGEIGGLIAPAAEPAYYGKPIPAVSFNQPFAASGKLVVDPRGGNTLFGFFNTSSLNEWRTPNTVVFRVNGRGEEGFHLHLEYCTSRWRAGGDFFADPPAANGKRSATLLPAGVHSWTLKYDPAGAQGNGAITATLDRETLTLPLDPGHKADGAAFNRFGILNVMKSADGGGTLWLDDLTINGVKEPLDHDPKWEGFQNRRTYKTSNIRPLFDFGYTKTQYAGGKAAGEIGGQLFRGDERYPERIGYYGDRIGSLSLEQPLKASGRIAMRRGVTDSTSLIGFFHSQGSTRVSTAQQSGFPENFVGLAIEGPSREGFYVYPAYGVDREAVTGNGQRSTAGAADESPKIYPDGKPHDWTLEYDPAKGTITVSLDGRANRMEIPADHRAIGAHFDRFGFITTHIDGNGQSIYLDDLAYTVQAAK